MQADTQEQELAAKHQAQRPAWEYALAANMESTRDQTTMQQHSDGELKGATCHVI